MNLVRVTKDGSISELVYMRDTFGYFPSHLLLSLPIKSCHLLIRISISLYVVLHAISV